MSDAEQPNIETESQQGEGQEASMSEEELISMSLDGLAPEEPEEKGGEESEEEKPEEKADGEKEEDTQQESALEKNWNSLTKREKAFSEEKRTLMQEVKDMRSKYEEQQKLIEMLDADAKSNPMQVLARAGWTEQAIVKHIMGTSDKEAAKEERLQKNPELSAMAERMERLEKLLSESQEKREREAEERQHEENRQKYLSNMRSAAESDPKYKLLLNDRVRGLDKAFYYARQAAAEDEGADLTPTLYLDRVLEEAREELAGLLADEDLRSLAGTTAHTGQSDTQKRPVTQARKSLTNRMSAQAKKRELPALDDEEGLIDFAVSGMPD